MNPFQNILGEGSGVDWKVHHYPFIGVGTETIDKMLVGYVVKANAAGNGVEPALEADDTSIFGIIVRVPELGDKPPEQVAVAMQGSFNRNQIHYADGQPVSAVAVERLRTLNIFLDPAMPAGSTAEVAPEGPTLDDSYDLAVPSYMAYALANTIDAVAQMVTGKGRKLYSIKFALRSEGVVAGNIVARLYAATGIIGINAQPSGAALATSEPIDAATVTTAGELHEFVFEGVNQVDMIEGDKFALSVEKDNANVWDNLNNVAIGGKMSGTHYGNSAFRETAGWTTDDEIDNVFQLYTT